MRQHIISVQQQEQLKDLLSTYSHLSTIITTIAQAGGQPYLVGGAVRDLLLDLPVKDIDIEVHGLSLHQLENVLKKFGIVDYVGKSFGVLRLQGLDVDWSLPRTDSSGRKPTVEIDPFMSLTEAFRRRDLTINAMGIHLVTFELVDPFNGLADVRNKILRATDPALFVEDPLRFFRVMQFVGRFEMVPDNQLNEICRTMDLRTVSSERIETEFTKLFLRSKHPSLGIRWLQHVGKLHAILPELFATIGVPQEPEWHPEGDVFEHSMQTLDAAASIACATKEEKLILMWAALCHDIGKSATTEIIC